MSSEIQKDDVILPGGLGTVNFGQTKGVIVRQFRSNDGATTLTVYPVQLSSEKIDDQTIKITCEQLVQIDNFKQPE